MLEIPIHIKTYSTYNHRGRTGFVGLRDSRSYESLCVEDTIYLERSEKNQTVPEQVAAINYLYPTPELTENHYREAQAKGITPEAAYLETSIDLNESTEIDNKNEQADQKIIRAMAGDFILRNRSFVNNNKVNHETEANLERYSLYRPDERYIQDVEEGTYLDIFRKRKDKETVYLRAEYQWNNGKWCTVSINPLRDDRSASSGGTDHINIPGDQECFLMLSRIKQSSARLEQIRLTLQHDGHAGNCPRVTRFKPVSDMKQDCKKLRENEDSDLFNTEGVISDFDELENILFEKGRTNPTLLIPDYEAYGKTLFELFKAGHEEYKTYLGEQDEEKHLKYLASSVCMHEKNWDLLNGDDITDPNDKSKTVNYKKDLQELAGEKKRLVAYVSLLARRLAWWIFQPAYQDMLFDYLYYYRDDSESLSDNLEKLFESRINLLSTYTTTSHAFTYLYEDAYDKYKSAVFLKNNPDPEHYARDDFNLKDFPEFWNRRKGKIRDNFDTLELYEKYNGKNWLLESFYPNTKQGVDLSLKILSCFAKPIIDTEGRRIGQKALEELPGILKNWINAISSDNQVIIELLEVSESQFHLGDKTYIGKQYFLTVKLDDKDTASKIADSEVVTGMKYCLATFDMALAVYNMHKEPNLSNSIQMLGATIEFGKVCRFLESSEATTFAKYFLKYTGEIVTIVLSVISFFTLAREGDGEAALIQGLGGVTIAVLSILTFGNPIAAFFLALAAIGVNIIANHYKTDVLEKWVRYTLYGDRYPQLKSGDYDGFFFGWENFYEKYLEKNLIAGEENSIGIGTDYWCRGIIDKLRNINITNNSFQTQTYYQIVNDFKIEWQKVTGFTRYAYYGSPDYDKTDILRIEIQLPKIDPKDYFKLELEVKQRDNDTYQAEYTLNGWNSYLKYDEKKGFIISSYIFYNPDYNDIIRTRGRCLNSNTTGTKGLKRAITHFKDFEEQKKMKINYIADNDLISFCNAGMEYETFKVNVKFYPYQEVKKEEKEEDTIPLLCRELSTPPDVVTWSSMG